jgi:predicted metal-dependent phosphotriesterase family hydrolase
MQIFVRNLLDNGFSTGDIRTMMVDNPSSLVEKEG